MRVFYFSGTGNTKLLAKLSAKYFGVVEESIEENLKPLGEEKEIIILYPIYGSLPPRIFRSWASSFLVSDNEVKVYCIVSQMGFSADGAMIIKEYLPPNCKIIHAVHINMPNNIANFPILKIGTKNMIRRKINRAKKKLKKHLELIKNKKYKLMGNSNFWHKMGKLQREGFLKSEPVLAKKVFVFENCIGCGKCFEVCPTKNYEIVDKKAVALGKCTLCLRCMYKCPVSAIGVLRKAKPKAIYNIEEYLND